MNEHLEDQHLAVNPEVNQEDDRYKMDEDVDHEVIKTSDRGVAYLFVVPNSSRFNQWLAALKIRYWIDFGNKSDYDVEWFRKTDSDGNLVELIVKLFSVSDDEDKQLLFAITVYLSKQKFMIQGKYRNLWKDNEFTSLRSFVDGLCTSNVLNPDQISSLYSETFQDADDSGSVKLHLDDVSLDVIVDSDCEMDENVKDPVFESSNQSYSKSLKSPSKKSHYRKSKVVSTPHRRKSSNLSRSPTKSFSSMGSVKIGVGKGINSLNDKDASNSNQKLFLNYIEMTNSRISKLEELVTKVDQAVATSDLEVNQLRNVMSNTHKDVSYSLDSRFKHELSIIKSSRIDFNEEINARLSKVESDINRYQGRVGSLAEEKTHLIKRISVLESKNETLQAQVESLKSLVQISENDRLESIQAASQSHPSHNQVFNAPCSNLPESALNPTNMSVSSNSVPDHDFVFLCDSNRKFLDKSQLFPNGHSKIIPCNTTDKAIEILKSPRFNVKSGVIINSGVNDVEHLSTEEVIHKQINMVHIAVQEFPNKYIIMSSITPRCDDLDRTVFEVNKAVYDNVKNIPNVILVDNGNLRGNALNFHDVKHLNIKNGVPLWASNLKDGIRKALGITIRPRSPRRIWNGPQQTEFTPSAQSTDDSRWSDVVSRNAVESNSFSAGVQNQLSVIGNMLSQLVQSNVNLHPPQQRVFYPSMPPGLGFCRPQFGPALQASQA